MTYLFVLKKLLKEMLQSPKVKTKKLTHFEGLCGSKEKAVSNELKAEMVSE
jgi:hypothetical protein